MKKQELFNRINDLDKIFSDYQFFDNKLPEYNPETYYLQVTDTYYFRALIGLRHSIKQLIDFYWSEIQGGYNVDLFMMTPSISSPMGAGSNSEAISIQFDKLKTFLVDSSQFGFEPLIINGFNMLYCYLPSMRGENPDKRHLNQFYHCEVELKGSLDELQPKIDEFIVFLCEGLLNMKNAINVMSRNPEVSQNALNSVTSIVRFDEIEFEAAIEKLINGGFNEYIVHTSSGRDILNDGELQLSKTLGLGCLPFWIKNYDRDRVPFYQKPLEHDSSKVINGDLIFPSLIDKSFGGEIVGAGQRQDDIVEMYESMKRQNVDPTPYEWYTNLRNHPKYEITSGFGLGIERFLTWILCREDIKEVILYPRIKNILTYP
jgi:asparaginyl-tRNA synthetase